MGLFPIRFLETSWSSSNEDPVIGMDGKTEDGAVPYQILRNQLEFLK